MAENKSEKQAIKGPMVLLKEAWAVFSQNPGTYIKIMGLSYLVGFVLVMILIAIGAVLYVATRSVALAFGIPSIIGIPALVYFQAWFGVSLTNALLADQEGKHQGVRETIKESKKFIVPFFATQLLGGIISLGGFLLFIIPGIILSVYFSLAGLIVLREGKKGMAALLTSREYIRGYAKTVFIYTAILGLISYALTSIPTYLFEEMDMSFLGSLYSLILNFILGPITILFSIGIYKELKRVKGEVTVTDVEKRKIKYYLLGALGIILPILFAYFIFINLIPLLNEMVSPPPSENLEVSPEEDTYIYPEAV